MTVDYAKAGPRDLLMQITVENAGPDEATLHVLPTLWFRNTWSWGVFRITRSRACGWRKGWSPPQRRPPLVSPGICRPRGRAPEAVSAPVRPRLVRHVLKLPTTPSREHPAMRGARGHHDRGLRQRPSVFRDPCPGRDRAVEPDRNRYPSRTGHRSTSWTPLGDPEQGPRPPASTAVRDGRCVETRSSRAYPRRSTVTVTNP